MHLAALPPIYVSGTSRTNFGNNRTGSDRMSTGYPLPPLGGSSTLSCAAAATGSVANATHTPWFRCLFLPLVFSPFFHLVAPPSPLSPLLCPLSFTLHCFFSLLLFRYIASLHIGESRQRGIIRNIVQFSYFIWMERKTRFDFAYRRTQKVWLFSMDRLRLSRTEERLKKFVCSFAWETDVSAARRGY